MHTPVLLDEAIRGLDVKEGKRYIDATTGEGGHLKKILAIGGQVLALDADYKQLEELKFLTKKFKNLTFVASNFADIASVARHYQFIPVDGILMDLGLSMRQIQASKRGFSYKKEDEVLDMRLLEEGTISAAQLLNTLTERELYDIFTKFGEEPNTKEIVGQIIKMRRLKKIQKVGELLFCIDAALGKRDIGVYKRIFQALRIAVNNELENLKKALLGSREILREDGRLVVISFHSLEDRIVKDFIKKNNMVSIHKKVVKGDQALSFEKSAKLRVITHKIPGKHETLN